MSALEATGLAKSYKSRQVVRDLSLELARGEVVGLLGPNGAGKTTAFYMIVGLVPCDAGRIRLEDTDVTLLPMHRRAQLGLGYLPQEASVFRKLNVEANVMAILETRSDLERAAREERLEQLLEELRIGHVRRTLGIRFRAGSGGGSRSPGRSPPSPDSCCSMSRSRGSIRSRCSISSASSASSPPAASASSSLTIMSARPSGSAPAPTSSIRAA